MLSIYFYNIFTLFCKYSVFLVEIPLYFIKYYITFIMQIIKTIATFQGQSSLKKWPVSFYSISFHVLSINLVVSLFPTKPICPILPKCTKYCSSAISTLPWFYTLLYINVQKDVKTFSFLQTIFTSFTINRCIYQAYSLTPLNSRQTLSSL